MDYETPSSAIHIDIPSKAPCHPNNELPKDGTASNPVQNGVFKLLHGWF